MILTSNIFVISSENKTIALNFLKDLRKSKEKQLKESEPSTKEEKIVFRKRERLPKHEVFFSGVCVPLSKLDNFCFCVLMRNTESRV